MLGKITGYAVLLPGWEPKRGLFEGWTSVIGKQVWLFFILGYPFEDPWANSFRSHKSWVQKPRDRLTLIKVAVHMRISIRLVVCAITWWWPTHMNARLLECALPLKNTRRAISVAGGSELLPTNRTDHCFHGLLIVQADLWTSWYNN